MQRTTRTFRTPFYLSLLMLAACGWWRRQWQWQRRRIRVHRRRRVQGRQFGSALGGAVGDLFGSEPPPPPEAEATLSVDENGYYFVESATDAHGGNAGSMSVAADRAASTINNLIDATGGRVLDPSDLEGFTIGYDGDGLYVNNQSFDSAADAIGHIVEQSLSDTAIEGGDVYLKRAVYRSLEDGFDPSGIQEALEAAQAYSRHQSQSVQIERLSEDEAVADELAALAAGELSRNDLSDAAQLVLDARETEAEARELGLHRNHRFDEASRLNDALEQAGVDLDGVAVTDLQIANLHGELVVAVRDPEGPDAPSVSCSMPWSAPMPTASTLPCCIATGSGNILQVNAVNDETVLSHAA